MDINTILLIIGLVGIGFIAYHLVQYLKELKQGKSEDQAFKMLQDQLFQLQKGLQEQDRNLNQQMQQSQQTLSSALQKQFDTSQQIIKEMGENSQKMIKESVDSVKSVTEKLTKLDETNKQVVGFAEQMKSLENILKNPKQRGVLGEIILENTLSNVLAPDLFKMQYSFQETKGEKIIVDAVIFFKDQIIPIDAKFSLENYNRVIESNSSAEEKKQLERIFKEDLKNRINETSKYVLPEKGTTDFAFMYIPADGIFYNLINEKIGTLEVNSVNLIEYAWKKKVILVSPMTFFAYLQTILHGLKALKIEEQAIFIQKKASELSRHLNAYQDTYRKLGDHLGKTVASYNAGSSEFTRIDKDIIGITEGEARLNINLQNLERPQSLDYQPSMEMEIKKIKKEVVTEELRLDL